LTLLSTPVRSSTPEDASVIASSVRSGGTSLTEPTRVVLPTPKPPAISSFAAVASPLPGSRCPGVIENRLRYVSCPSPLIHPYRGCTSSQQIQPRTRRPGRYEGRSRPRRRAQHRPDALHHHVHRVGDHAHVRVGCRQQGQARATARRGDEQERVVHLHERLPHPAATELPSRAAGQTLEPGRDRGQVFGLLGRHVAGIAHQQPVGRQHHRPVRPRDLLHQIVEQPTELTAPVRHRGPSPPATKPLPSRPSRFPWSCRARCVPRWKPAKRLRAASASNSRPSAIPPGTGSGVSGGACRSWGAKFSCLRLRGNGGRPCPPAALTCPDCPGCAAWV